MKILHCVHLEIPAGKENRLYHLLKAEAERDDGLEHEILHTGDKIHEKFRTFLQENYNVYEYKTFKGIRIPKFIRPYFLQRRITLSHDVNLFYEIQDMQLMNLFAHSAKGGKVFYDGGHSWFLNPEESIWLNKFNFFFSNTNASKVMLNKRWHVPEERIRVIYNSYLPEYVEKINRVDTKDIKNLREKYKLGSAKVVLYVGRFITLKGIHSLIEALDYLPEGEDIRLVLVGDGKMGKQLGKMIQKKKKENQVVFAGMQIDTAPFYRMADVTVVPSAREPFGNVNLEAALAGSPIIASRIDGIPEIIPDDGFGYLLKPTIEPSRYPYLETSSMPDYVVDPDTQELTRPKFLDPEELAGTISLVLEKEKGKAKEKAARLKERVKREFSTEKRGERFRELVAEITRS